MRSVVVLLLGLIAPLAAAVECGPKQVKLIELYTSQGCSSCPPAEKWLNSYADNPGLWTKVIPLAFHVDYWDYLGWKDTYAQNKFSQRQRMLAREGILASVYTPGFLVSGSEWRGFFKRQYTLPKGHNDQVGMMSLSIENNNLHLSFEPHVDYIDKAKKIHYALIGRTLSTEITRGENSGKTLKQDFVVLQHEIKDVDSATKKQLLRLSSKSGYDAVAVWLTDSNQKPIQACGFDIASSKF